MKNSIYLDDIESLRTAYLEANRGILGESFQGASHQEVAALLRETMEGLSPAEQQAFAQMTLQNTYENIFQDIGRSLSQAGSAVVRALPTVARIAAPIAQVAAPLVGTLIGGPAGAMAGRAVSGLIGNLAGQPSASGAPPRRPLPPTAPATGQPAQRPATASPTSSASSQLMSLLANPQLLQAILAQVMGGNGPSGATVSSQGQQTTIPFGALMNSLSELALRAAEASVSAGGMESEAYLLDHSGNYRVEDPSNPAQRADAVLELLNEQYTVSSTSGYPVTPAYSDAGEWLLAAGLMHH